MLVCRGGDRSDGLTGSWDWAGEVAGENGTPAVAGVVDGGAYGHRFFVEGIDVVTLTFLPDLLRGKP